MALETGPLIHTRSCMCARAARANLTAHDSTSLTSRIRRALTHSFCRCLIHDRSCRFFTCTGREAPPLCGVFTHHMGLLRVGSACPCAWCDDARLCACVQRTQRSLWCGPFGRHSASGPRPGHHTCAWRARRAHAIARARRVHRACAAARPLLHCEQQSAFSTQLGGTCSLAVSRKLCTKRVVACGRGSTVAVRFLYVSCAQGNDIELWHCLHESLSHPHGHFCV